MEQMERLLAMNCTPVLTGVKPASLVSCAREAFPTLEEDLKGYAEALAEDGIRFRILCACDRRQLLLVYRERWLTSILSRPSARALLTALGYTCRGEDVEAMLTHLSLRIGATEGFPHEIGLFLGYSLEDVLGFMHHAGRNYKVCGCWKVYGDVRSAMRQFARMERIRQRVWRRLEQGETLLQVLGAA